LPQRNVNTVVTNVPGPAIPLYAGGREMLDYLPFVPLASGVRIGVAILSYNGRLGFGITGDFDTAPDIDVVADGIDAAIVTLLDLAAAQSSASSRRGEALLRREQPLDERRVLQQMTVADELAEDVAASVVAQQGHV
jgi:hypothetical protein